MKYFNFVLFVFLFQFNFLSAQIETTGTIIIDPSLSVKLDKDITNSLIKITLTGLSDRWFSIGLNAQLMLMNADCLMVTSNTQFSDMYFPGGHAVPLFDSTNDWTVISNNINNNLRTIVASRSFNTGDNHDLIFTAQTNNLNYIWAYSSIPGFDLISHGADNYGGGVFVFSNLGLNNSENNLFSIYPNPSQNNINFITNANENCKVIIADCLGKTIYSNDFFGKEFSIDISNFKSGFYFVTLTSLSKKSTLKFLKK
jgi:hypothetical protein